MKGRVKMWEERVRSHPEAFYEALIDSLLAPLAWLSLCACDACLGTVRAGHANTAGARVFALLSKATAALAARRLARARHLAYGAMEACHPNLTLATNASAIARLARLAHLAHLVRLSRL